MPCEGRSPAQAWRRNLQAGPRRQQEKEGKTYRFGNEMELGRGPLLGLGRKVPRGLSSIFVCSFSFSFADFLFVFIIFTK
jgi:hypothetical protein